jgi:signal transduction histidine kinase
VDQLMTLARLDPQQRQPAVPDQADLSALIRQKLTEPRRLAGQLKLNFVADIEPVRCPLDPDSFRILLRNLLDNAFRYTPAGGSIRLCCRAEGQHAVLSLADSGPGLPAGMRERVFERFVRLNNTGTPGSGLGLSIVKNIVAAHRASIALKDGPDGRGLLVEIRFALAPAHTG